MSGVYVAQLVLQLKRIVVRIPPSVKFSFFVQFVYTKYQLYRKDETKDKETATSKIQHEILESLKQKK